MTKYITVLGAGNLAKTLQSVTYKKYNVVNLEHTGQWSCELTPWKNDREIKKVFIVKMDGLDYQVQIEDSHDLGVLLEIDKDELAPILNDLVFLKDDPNKKDSVYVPIKHQILG